MADVSVSGVPDFVVNGQRLPRDPTWFEPAVERARLAGARWFAEHDDGASSEDEWRDHYRAVLEAALEER